MSIQFPTKNSPGDATAMATDNVIKLKAAQDAGVDLSKTEDALALTFVERHGGELRYVDEWSKWLVWNSTVWQQDKRRAVFNLARQVCRETAADCEKPGKASQLSSAKTRAAVLSLASDDQRVATVPEQWDSNRDVFVGGNVSVNLKTGERYPPRREDCCTKAAAVAPGGDCNLWLEFLERVTAGDGELIKYLQRISGYMLTGHVSEHALFFLYGTGGNGKGTFVDTLTGIWGDYAFVAPADVFIESNNERHPTELAALLGARLVASSETPSGRHWNESRIKMLTGGDRIAARFMRGDYFNFDPQFKLLINGNHKPSLRTVNDAIRRRMHLIPFTVSIPEKERDLGLREKLKTEWPGILQWAIDGCAEWRRIGLQPPKAVRTATEDYLQGEDNTLTWLEERATTEDPNAEASTSELFASWKDWCEHSGARCGSKKAFSGTLTDKGFQSVHNRKGTVFYGIRLGQR